MDDFRELYRRIEYLRNNGIKMKEIADCAGMAPSILSSLYTTVLPTYFEELKNCSHEEALDHAIVLVNNISKRRLLSVLPELLKRLEGMEPNIQPDRKANPRTFARRNTAFHHTGGQHMRTLHELQPFFFLGLPEDGTFYHQSIRKQGVHPHRTVKCLRGGAMGHGSHR